MPILEKTVEINGETINKERYGMASVHDDNKTFTGNVLFKRQLRTNYDDSIESKFEDAVVVDDIVYWKSNGAIPFADMILDFVQIDAISPMVGELSIRTRQEDDTNFWKEYGLPVLGDESGTVTKNEAVRRAFERRDERKARIEEVA